MDSLPTSDNTPAAPAWHRLSIELFEREGLGVLFAYARNLLTGTVIVAAGLHAAHHQGQVPMPGFWWSLHYTGYAVALVGVVMLMLNLADGLRRLARREQPLLLRIAAATVYIAMSMRLTQVIVLFRYGF
jgi:hypothetical protein